MEAVEVYLVPRMVVEAVVQVLLVQPMAAAESLLLPAAVVVELESS